MDLSNDGMQPFIFTQPDSTIYIMCNGEIYNFTHILEKYNFQTQSHSDCEIIGHLFLI